MKSVYAICICFWLIPAVLLAGAPSNWCVLWFDATNVSSLDVDEAGRVMRWRDLSGHGNHLVQEAENRRPVRDGSSVRFNGSEWISLAGDPGVAAAKAMTVIAVFETEEEHPQRLMGILGNGGHTPNREGMMIGFNDRDLITQDNAAALMVTGAAGEFYEVGGSASARRLQINRLLAPQVGNLLTVQWQSGADPFARIFYFGEDRSEGFPEFPGALRLDSLEGLTVGAADASGAFPFTGKIREVLVFDRVLADEERVRIETTLAEKHAIARPSEYILDPRAEQITLERANAISGDGALLRLAGGVLYESRDGEEWVKVVEGEPDPSVPDIAPGGLLTRTHQGTLISVTANRSPAYWTRLELTRGVFNSDEAMSHVYAFRSVDGGATWQDATLLQTDYCGAIRDIIVTSQGHIVVSVQAWDREHERHITVIHVSTDDGLSYHRADVDNGIGRGLHDGFFESTVTELSDGRIWMLGRTSLGVFWESFSEDGGLSWSAPEATQIDAGGYPGLLLRLASGVQVLAWNRYYREGYEGRDDLINVAGVGLFWGTTATSRYNSQMSVMFSADDGATWTDPVLIAAGRQNFVSIRYPHLYEPRPGEIYLWAGTIALRFHAADFIKQ